MLTVGVTYGMKALLAGGANEIASCIFDYIENMSEKGLKHFVFYSDNCMAQNKNTYYLYVSMLWYALHRFSLTCVEHKYLEKGHTQNENDTIHSSIESASKKISIYTTAQSCQTQKAIQSQRNGSSRFFLL